MNEAFLMNNLWNLIKNPEDLWCKVLRSKYGRINDLIASISAQPYDSPLWKALVNIWNDFQGHVVWNIRDGRNTNFWLDKWVPNNGALIAIGNEAYVDTTLSVRDVLSPSGNWNMDFLMNNLPADTVSQILALPVPNNDDGPDTIGWVEPIPTISQLKGLIPCSIRISRLWRVIGQVFGSGMARIASKPLFGWPHILTNFRRRRWGGGISPTCPSCGNEVETVLHVLRDCIHATKVWLYIVHSDFITNFFSFDCRGWFFNNLNKKDSVTNTLSWKTTFMTMCWYLWKWRNKTIFEADFIRPNNQIL